LGVAEPVKVSELCVHLVYETGHNGKNVYEADSTAFPLTTSLNLNSNS